MTGPAAAFDKPVVEGVEAAIKYWNDKGGYKGRKVELRLLDDFIRLRLGKCRAGLGNVGHCGCIVRIQFRVVDSHEDLPGLHVIANVHDHFLCLA